MAAKGRSTGYAHRARQPVAERLLRELFNGKLRDELLDSEIFYSMKEVRILTDSWRTEYNQVRSHSSLAYMPPQSATIKPSLRMAIGLT